MSNYLIHIIIMGLFYAYLSTAWNIVGGFAGQHSLGHALFIGIGAYCSTFLFVHFGLSPWIGVLVGSTLASVAALIMGFLSFRYGVRGPYFLLVTLAFAEIAKIAVANAPALGASSGLSIPLRGNAPSLFQFDSKWPYLWIILALCILTLSLSFVLRRSWFGYSLLAIRENEGAARACGVAAERLKIIALIISAAMCAIGGTFYAQYTLFIEPQSLFGIGLSLELVLFSIVGGIGTVFGPAIGALVLFFLAEGSRNVVGLTSIGNLHLIIYANMLLLVVIFLPDGFSGAAKRLLSRVRTRRAFIAPKVSEATHLPIKTKRSSESALVLDGVTKRFGGLVALSNVSLTIPSSECLGIIGPNGSGKSTLINVIAGVYRPNAGAVAFQSRPISGLHPEQICRLGIGRTHQIAQPFGELTSIENVMIGAFARTYSRKNARSISKRLLERFEIGHLSNDPVRTLTAANRKKIEIARALATNPTVLLLDEALAGLTESECERMIQLLLALRSEGLTLIVVEHVMRVVTALCDRVLVLNFGEVMTIGVPADVLRNPQVISAYLGNDDHAATFSGR